MTVDEQIENAKAELRKEYQSILQDGMVMGMRNIHSGLKQYFEKAQSLHTDITAEGIDSFLEEYIAQAENEFKK